MQGEGSVDRRFLSRCHLLGCDDSTLKWKCTSDPEGRTDSPLLEGTIGSSKVNSEEMFLFQLSVLSLPCRPLLRPIDLQSTKAGNIKTLECMGAVRGVGNYDNVVLSSEVEKSDSAM